MILRKPYAIFIKYFRLFHLIMAVFSATILYRSFTLYNFFRVYSIDYRSVLKDFSVSKYMGNFSFIFVIIILLINILLLSVMFYKKKPKSLYLFNLALFIFVIILYFFCSSTLNDVEGVIINIKTSKALRDLTLIAALLQSVSLIMTIVRATGFDIKQFDFGKDLQELDISEKDSEEIEVAVEFDKDEIKRDFKNKIRNIKYVYFEHKFIINTVFISFVLITSTLIFFRVRSYTDRYNEGSVFNASSVTFNVLDSFILDSTIGGSQLVSTEGDDAGAIVAVRIQAKGYGSKQSLNTGLLTLIINGLSYGQNPELAKELYDMGSVYNNEYLTEEFTTYLFTFEVSKEQAKRSMILKINDDTSFVGGVVGAKNVLVKLKPEDLRKTSDQVFNKKIGDTLSFDDSILGSSTLNITSFEINNRIKLNYNYCYGQGKCMDSYEYVTPTATGNYFKTLMRINGDMSIDKNLNISDVYDMRTFFNTFGVITYKVGDDLVSKKIDSQAIKPKSAIVKDYFIEVPYEVKDSSEIYLSFKIRNKSYKYTLK